MRCGPSLSTLEARLTAFWIVTKTDGFTRLFESPPYDNHHADIDFMDSDQLIKIAGTLPHESPTPVRITTITLDHGLLRCTPVAGEYNSEDRYGGQYSGSKKEAFIDLQPDGNR